MADALDPVTSTAPLDAAVPPAASEATLPDAGVEAGAPASAPAEERSPSLLETVAPVETLVPAKPDETPEAAAPAPAPDASGEKPAEKAADDKALSADGEAASPTAELPPIEYEYKLPETLEMDDALKSDFHAALDEMRRDPAKGPQKLIELHEAVLQKREQQLRDEQWRVFNDMRKEWVSQVKADDELGGAGHHTALQAAARMRDEFVSSAPRGSEQYNTHMQEFQHFLAATGAGDHPAFLRLLHNVAQVFDEPQMAVTEVRPPPNPQGKPRGASVLYDKSNFNGS